MATLTEKVNELITVVARFDERQKASITQNNSEHGTIRHLLEKQNGRVKKNEENISNNKSSISKIIGYGLGVVGVVGVSVTIIGYLINK